MNEILSIASGVVMVVANIFYAWTVVYGKTEPTRGSWITWAILDVAILMGMYTEGTLNGQIIGGTIGSVSIMCLACLGWGKPGWTLIERVCLWIFPCGLILWYFTTNAEWNIGISLTLLVVGCFPTYWSAWKNPHCENRTAWTLTLMSSLLMLPILPAVGTWTIKIFITEALQPLVFLATQLPMMYLLWWRPYMKKK